VGDAHPRWGEVLRHLNGPHMQHSNRTDSICWPATQVSPAVKAQAVEAQATAAAAAEAGGAASSSAAAGQGAPPGQSSPPRPTKRAKVCAGREASELALLLACSPRRSSASCKRMANCTLARPAPNCTLSHMMPDRLCDACAARGPQQPAGNGRGGGWRRGGATTAQAAGWRARELDAASSQWLVG